MGTGPGDGGVTHRSLQFISQNNKKEGRSDITGKGKFFGVVLSELITASSERCGRTGLC